MIRYPINTIEKDQLVDGEVLNDVIRDLRDRSYGFQDKVQLDNIVLEKFVFPFTKFNKTVVDNSVVPVRRKYLAYVEYQFINSRKKLLFKRSGLKNQELSMFDVSENSNIFSRNYMVFIEGIFVDCINIIPDDGELNLVINILNGEDIIGITDETFKDWHDRDVDVHIVFFSNSGFNPLITNREILSENSNFLSLQDSGIVGELATDETYLTFITTNSLGYKSNLIDTTNKHKMTQFFKKIDGSEPTVERSFINIFGFRNLSEFRIIQSNINVFQLPGYNMPVPIENILIFRNLPDGKVYAPEITFNRNHPNFYTVNGNVGNDELSLLIFHTEGNIDDKYIDGLESYYRIMGNGVSSFYTAPNSVLFYQPTTVEYTIKEYMDSISDDTLDYKLEKLSGLVDRDPELIRYYLKTFMETTDKIYIDMSTIDLTKRIRTDNTVDIVDSSIHKTFTEQRYVLTFRNIMKSDGYNIRIFIDGIHYYPDTIYTKNEYVFLYVPITMINANSFIEIERFKISKQVTDFTISNLGDVHTLSIPIDTYVHEDIFIVNKESGVIMDSSKFTFFTTYDDNTEKTLIPGSFETIKSDTLKFKVLDNALLGQTLELHVEKGNYITELTVNVENDRQIYDLPLNVYSRYKYMRLFINGRLINPLYNEMNFDNGYFGTTKITTKIYTKVDNKIIVDYTPNIYELVTYMENLPENNVLYLHGIIDRPFDLEWYDVYVNGKKMNKFNIDILSPFLIQVRQVEAIYNLEIYRRKNMADPIYVNESSTSIIDDLWLNDVPFRNALLSHGNASTNTEGDILLEAMYAYLDSLKDLFESEITYIIRRINPDEQQITDEIIAKYPLVFKKLLNGGNIIHINGDSWFGTEITNVMHINPDINYS